MNVATHKKSTFRLSLLLVILIAAVTLAACGEDDSEGIDYPAVQLHVGDQSFSEPVYQYYWPRAADDVTYDVNFDAYAQIGNTVPVRKGDQVRFSVDDEPSTLGSFSATILDSSNAVQDLNASSGAFDAELPDGVYRVRVDAEYADVKGHAAFVSYVFELEIAGIVLPTPTPTVTPTPLPTATNTPTPIPTATLTPLPTATPTKVPTVTPLPTDTLEPTVDISTAVELGEIPVTGTVRLTGEGGPIGVAGARVTITHTSDVAPDRNASSSATTTAGGAFAFDPITLSSIDLVTIRAEAPGYQPQTVERSGQEIADSGGIIEFTLQPVPQPTAPPPTNTPAPTATAIPPTAAVVSASSVPAVDLSYAGRDYTPAGYRFCELNATRERVCVELPVEDATPERIEFSRGASAQLTIDGPRPDTVRIVYLTDTGTPTGQPENRTGDTIVLFMVTPEPGSYIMSITMQWAETDVTYFFRVAVSD